MDTMSNKAIYIAVGLLVTMIITTGIIFTVTQIKDIYKQVNETDITLLKGFDEYDKYSNTICSGIDVLNAANKYIGSPLVSVKMNGNQINTADKVKNLKADINDTSSLSYNAKVERKDDNIEILFTDK